MTYLAPLLVFLLLAAPGIRLLTLSWKTREVPELLCGLYFLGASIGISLRVLGTSLQWSDPELSLSLNSIGHVALASGTIFMAVFTQRVFHAASHGAKTFAGFTIAAIMGTTLHSFLSGQIVVENSFSLVATNTARIVPTAWAFVESFRYWRAMKRRANLGLSDPVVTNRFLLWSLWTGGVSGLPLIALMVRVAALVMFGGQALNESNGGELAPQVLALIRLAFLVIVPVSVTALSLSFFPPRIYIARLRSRAEAYPATAST
jgi:hypothetical protein